jgi:hypothetical protein
MRVKPFEEERAEHTEAGEFRTIECRCGYRLMFLIAKSSD